MFKLKLLPEDFFNICIKRKVEIKKLDKLPKLDNNYLLFIAKYQEVEIIPDISLFNYEEALNENRYLECNYPEISRCFWSIGQAGQGDGWFLNKIDNATKDNTYAMIEQKIDEIKAKYTNYQILIISAKNRFNIDELMDLIKKNLIVKTYNCKLLIPYVNTEIAARVHRNTIVKSESFVDEGIVFAPPTVRE